MSLPQLDNSLVCNLPNYSVIIIIIIIIIIIHRRL
jgi:hypothetical protein